MALNFFILQCTPLEKTSDSSEVLYAKIGCFEREREHYTSTKLWIHVYTDEDCTKAYDDGQSKGRRVKKGYVIGDTYFNAKVSFRPSFYSCTSCQPSSIASSFSKEESHWYDHDDWFDDYVPADDVYYKIQQYVNNQVKYYKNDDDDFYTNNDDNRRRLATPENHPEVRYIFCFDEFRM